MTIDKLESFSKYLLGFVLVILMLPVGYCVWICIQWWVWMKNYR